MEPYEKPPAAYAVGEEIFKEYRMKNFIGQGGFGRVFLVENQSGIPFALKVLHRNVGMERRGVDKTQEWCWSSDRRSSGSAWVVNFSNGNVSWYSTGNFVRCVRRGQ